MSPSHDESADQSPYQPPSSTAENVIDFGHGGPDDDGSHKVIQSVSIQEMEIPIEERKSEEPFES